ncbi:choice-of-anchor B family protein [Aquimarina litoralis]|uniref:choice-of-anchor B family protein n=1 Tax=Aquimarina litoralis TaxID=584605 RepID=UPI001C583023|nr:choice-of-anchor B family protein [Aquimarina litoralis]
MKKLTLALSFLVCTFICQSQTPCTNGFAGSYPCNDYDLMSRISLSQMSASSGNDSWGWTDSQTSKEYAIIGLNNGTAFIDVSDPTSPIYLGKLPTATSNSLWRDVKVYSNHAYIVSEASGHGMQVFDLTRLRNVSNPPVTFSADTRYTQFGNAHNIVINEDTGYAYIVGAQRGSGPYNGGPLFVNIQDPKNPINAGGFLSGGQRAYTHDAQVVTYSGPDPDYTGREILIGSNEIEVVIADITDKSNPVTISTIRYPNIGYVHQGWFTDDMRYFLLGDETDEQGVGFNTRTIIFDFQDLDNPQQHMIYNGPTAATDHNGYVKGDKFYLANYRAGFRVIDISDIGNTNINEIGYFDTFPSSNSASFNGVWNVYPYFASGNIVISDIEGGFFLVRKSDPGNGGGDDCASVISSFPFDESFESSFGSWQNATGDDLNWTRDSGGTPSNGTGPSTAADGSTYIYVEASGNGTGYPNKNAILNSPCLNFTNLSSPNLEFQYHMLGSAINSLTVEARTDNQGSWTSIFSRNGDQGSNWNAASVDLSSYAGQASVQLRFSVLTGNGNQGWQSDIAIDAISISDGNTPPPTCDSIDFRDFQITPFSNQDAAGNFSVNGSGTTLTLTNNTWKYIPFNYTVTSNTVIEFEFRSSSQGEIHAVGFENDNSLTSSRYFKVHGTQNYGITNYDNYSGNGFVTYVIPVGSFYTGSMDRLVFINDNDSGSGNNSEFTSVKIYEGSCSRGTNVQVANANIIPVFGTEDEDIMALKIYPNPIQGQNLNVFLNMDKMASYEIITISGQLVGQGNVTESIDVSNLKQGIYLLKVFNDNQQITKQFIKK